MAGVLTSNHPISLSESEREATSGMARRLLAVKMPLAFEMSSDADVKDLVLAGVFNTELFHWCSFGYKHITKLAGFKRVYPQPPRFVMDTAAILEGTLHGRIQEWVETNTTPQRAYDTGSSQALAKAALAEAFTLEPRVVAGLVTASGLVEKRSGSARVYMYEYPAEGRARCVQLKPRGEWL